jgi:hypothetical protein
MENVMNEILGQRIATIRKATAKELLSENWKKNDHLQVIVLANGIKLYPSRDYEGNGPGGLFGEYKDGRKFGI